ncbi:MAG: hypothetical protein DI587_14850 [Variovorax paradoxus]|nr:MAG: hypothetical protein DI583_14850 [Variovorax paradoxus]PZQ09683.1 MAG: hypothetical protein DI587_14850 [Variovorax paradoxus]
MLVCRQRATVELGLLQNAQQIPHFFRRADLVFERFFETCLSQGSLAWAQIGAAQLDDVGT